MRPRQRQGRRPANRSRWLCAILMSGAACQSAAGDGLFNLLVGEYNNNEQVWQQQLDGETPYQRRHWRFERLGTGRLQLATASGQAAGQPSWVLALAANSFGVEVVGLNGEEAICRYRWRPDGSGFTGQAVPANPCPEALPQAWRIGPTHLLATFREGDEKPRVHQARRVQHYSGWIALQRQRIDANANEEDFIFLQGLRVHDEGFVIPVTDAGRPTGYAIELARLTYQNTNTAVLKLGVVEQATGKTLSYSWAAPLAERIGINLRWIQSGFTKAVD